MKYGILWAGAALLSAAVWAETPAVIPAKPPVVSSIGKGYLTMSSVPDAALMLPPPPAEGSAALARDEEAAKAALTQQGTARWELAKLDADVFTPKATTVFSCAAGLSINEKDTPKLQALMRHVMADLGMASYAVKRKYQRARPFMSNGAPTCTPEMEGMLRKDGSYPSGHSAIGYGEGLILAEIFPDRAAQLVARGRAYGDSRRICNVHYLSDVEEGRVAAAAVVARLHADPDFQKDLAAVKAEMAKIKRTAPTTDCAAEVATLAGTK